MGVRQGRSRSGRTLATANGPAGGMPYTYMLENFFPELRSSLRWPATETGTARKVISQKRRVKEPEPVLQPDSVAEPASETGNGAEGSDRATA